MQLKTILNRVEPFKSFVYGKVRWVEEATRPTLEVEIHPRKNGRAICSDCGRPGPGYDRMPSRRFHFVPLWGMAVFFAFAPGRVVCHPFVNCVLVFHERRLAMTPLRKRMIEDLRVRNYSPRTVQHYTSQVAMFARYFGRSPDQLGPKHIHQYQVYLVSQKKCSWSNFNNAVCALRFLYRVTLRKDWMIKHLP
jgi:hypothetical protein